jgi:ABC-type transporter Mla MlaB component
MEPTSRRAPERVVVRIAGDLTASNTARLRRLTRSLSRATAIEVDLSGVKQWDWLGIAALVSTLSAVRRNAAVEVHNVPLRLLAALREQGFDRLFPVSRTPGHTTPAPGDTESAVMLPGAHREVGAAPVEPSDARRTDLPV